MYRLHCGIMASGDGLYAAVRSFGPAAWYQPGVGLTGALTVSNWADQSGNGRDLAQATAGNQPIYLPYSGTAYGYLPGVAGNYFSTPDSAAFPTSDFDIRVHLAANDWTPSADQFFFSKYTAGGSQKTILMAVKTTGVLQCYYSIDGAGDTSVASTAAPTVSDGGDIWVRWTRIASSGVSTFYTSPDGSTWTQLGNTVTNGAGSGIFNSTAGINISGHNSGASGPFTGKVYRAIVKDSVDGTTVYDFSPSTFAETSTNGATAVASTGETWTLNSTGAKPAQIVKSASLLGDGTNHFMDTAAFTLNKPTTFYVVGKQIAWNSGRAFLDGLNDGTGIVRQNTATPGVGLYAGSIACTTNDLAVGAKGIITAVFNGASSSTTINAGTPATGDSGAAGDMGGIRLMDNGGAGGNRLNGQIWELIAFSAAHTAAQRAVVRQYLAVRH